MRNKMCGKKKRKMLQAIPKNDRNCKNTIVKIQLYVTMKKNCGPFSLHRSESLLASCEAGYGRRHDERVLEPQGKEHETLSGGGAAQKGATDQAEHQ